MKKTRSHKRTAESCVKARKALVMVVKLLDDRYGEDGAPRSEEELRMKSATAASWLQTAETELAQARTNLIKEIEHRENEADPETIRHRKFQEEVKRLQRQPKRRRKAVELAPDVRRLRAEGMVPAAIADTLHTSDSTVKRILREGAS
jgi:DNA invertase Pin-like site-specific DNA recombinase